MKYHTSWLLLLPLLLLGDGESAFAFMRESINTSRAAATSRNSPSGVALEDIKLSEESKYTQLLLMEVINQTLAKAAVEDWHTQQRSTQNWYASDGIF